MALGGWVFVVRPVLVWGLRYSQQVRNGLHLQGRFRGAWSPFLVIPCRHASLATGDSSPVFLRLAMPRTATCLFSCSKKILTLDMKQDPPPHPNTLRLQRMIRYSATLFVQVKPPLSTTQRVDRAHGLLVLCSYTSCSLGLHVCQPHLEKNLHVKRK